MHVEKTKSCMASGSDEEKRTSTLLDFNIDKKRKVDEEIEVGIGVRRVFFLLSFPPTLLATTATLNRFRLTTLEFSQRLLVL